MKKLLGEIFASKTILLLSVFILSLHLLMRLYNIESLLGYGHDEDLGAWIVKDIVVDKHIRLIGQETSIDSFFIGPLFYYFQAIYFLIFEMDPIGGLFLTVTISVLTLISVFYIFRRFFGLNVGIIGAFIYACSQALAGHDKWVVPTQPTLLWTVWYLFALFLIIENRNPKSLILLGILLGLIWHTHVAFIPLLLLIPLAIFISSKTKSLKQFLLNRYLILGGVILFILMLPFFAFEIRHGFIQTNGLLAAVSEERNQVSGFKRLFKIYDGFSWSFMNIFYEVRTTASTQIRIFQGFMFLVFLFLLVINFKTLGKKSWIILTWLILVILSQLISKRAISEYYFTNLTIIEILVAAVFLGRFLNVKKGSLVVILVLTIFAVINVRGLVLQPSDQEGYLARKKIISYISSDAKQNNYPCISINYMTTPGKSAGYRYFFEMNNLKLITPANDVAVYSIVNPAPMAEKELAFSQGAIGVILPNHPKVDPNACNKPERQLLPPWGFNN